MKYYTLDQSKNYIVEFETYADTHEDARLSNTMYEKLQGCMYLP